MSAKGLETMIAVAEALLDGGSGLSLTPAGTKELVGYLHLALDKANREQPASLTLREHLIVHAPPMPDWFVGRLPLDDPLVVALFDLKEAIRGDAAGRVLDGLYRECTTKEREIADKERCGATARWPIYYADAVLDELARRPA